MNVLVAVDRSRHAQTAARFLETVRVPSGSTVSLLHVVEVPYVLARLPGQYGQLPTWRKDAVAEARRLLDRIVRFLEAQRLRIRPVVKEGLPSSTILDVIKRSDIDLAVLGPRGMSRIARFLLGSVTELILDEGRCTTLVVKGTGRIRADRDLHVIVAMDFSEHARVAATFLTKLTLPPRSRVTLLHVVERAEDTMARFIAKGRTDLYQAVEGAILARKDHAARLLEQVGRRLERRGMTVVPVLADGHPADEIISMAQRQRGQLVVVGSRGMTEEARRTSIGSVSRRVARHAPCPVLVVRTASR